MRLKALICVLSVLALADCAPAKHSVPAQLAWAYPKADKPGFIPDPPAGPQHVPGSDLTFTKDQIADETNPPDWFPAEHPPAPFIVAHSRKSGVQACAACHLFSGEGFLAAPDLAGLPQAYIVEQVHDFRAGRRASAEAGRPDAHEMVAEAQRVSDPDLAQAAAYFSGLPRRPWARVVETNTVPVARPSQYGWMYAVPNGGSEPIGDRIVELPVDAGRMFLSDPHVGVVDYVPKGEVARGEALVKSGGPSSFPCSGCHGPELKGMGPAPPIAGRAASSVARALWDIETGARAGPAVAPMQGEVANLTPTDITAISAYLASLRP